MTRVDKIRHEHIRGTTRVVRPCDEDERGAHSGKNARCGQEEETGQTQGGNMLIREITPLVCLRRG